MAETISPAPAPRRRRLWLRILVGVFGVLVVLLVVGYFVTTRSEEHTSELQSRLHLVCRLLLEYKKADSSRIRRPTLNISIIPSIIAYRAHYLPQSYYRRHLLPYSHARIESSHQCQPGHLR